MINVSLTKLAERDIAETLYYSENNFGTVIKNKYLSLIYQAITDIGDNPKRLGVKSVVNRQDYYHYHLSNSVNNVKGQQIRKPSHLLVFYWQGDDTLTIARLLHDRMLIERHLH